MKLFLKNIILFFVILYGSLLALMLLSNFVVNSNANFKLKPDITKIIIGNSQPEAAYNDSLIPHLKNIANAGESYFYGYQKLKKVLEQNTQINTVYIEFNPTTILIREDDKIWTDRFIKYQVPNNIAFFDFNDHKLLAKKNTIGYKQSVLKGIKNNFKRIMSNQYNFIDSIGGYHYVNWSHTDSILNVIKNKPTPRLTTYTIDQKKISNSDILYLKKMLELCKKKNIKTCFIRTPYHNKFKGRLIENYFQEYRKKNFKDIEFLDYKDFPLDDSEFADMQHVNYKGAIKISLQLEKHVNK